jgi:DNA repair protein RadA/Sms
MTTLETGAGGQRTRSIYACGDCGARHAKWTGRCGTCGAWNALTEEVTAGAPAGRAQPALGPLQRLDQVDPATAQVRPTGIGELDRVLGGGLVPGSVTVLGGEPGIGKTTLAMQLLGWWAGPTLYISGEESPQQVKQRALRLGITTPNRPSDEADPARRGGDVWIAAEVSLRGILDAVERTRPDVVVIDSIQTIADERIASSPGSSTQIRECTQQLVVEAKRRGVAMVLVGHVTKEGALAGPRALEHVVDTVLSFEGERHHALRLLRAVKHRFGATDELGLFEMTSCGLVGVPDPSHLFLDDRRRGVAGSVIASVMEGQRPLLVEIQALTVQVPMGAPARRTTQGLDSSRLAMLLAVVERRAGLRVGDQDVYASTVGGVRILEPGADLAVALAVVSAVTDIAVAAPLVAIGEVGLGGEVRQVPQTARRLAEAARLGYRTAFVPVGAPADGGIRSVEVESLADAVALTVGPVG